MSHYLHIFESTTLFGGTTVTDLDLDNSGGSSKFRLLAFRRGEPQFKEVFADSPQIDSKRLVSYRLAAVQEEIDIAIEATSIDDLLTQINNLQSLLQIKARDAQVARNSGGAANYFWLADRPLGTSTKTYKSEIISGEVLLPQGFYDTNMLAFLAGEEGDPVTVRLLRHPYVSASTLTILNGVSADNGAGDYVDIGASGGTAVTGDLPAPLSAKIVGGDTNTNRVVMAMRMRGTPSNFKQIYWAKDATITGSYTVTNAVLTSNVATLTIGTHTFAVGDRFTAASISLSAVFNGSYTITAITATTISYARVNANIGTGASTGTVTGETIALTGNYTVTNAVLTSNVATLTIGTHNHVVGDTIVAASISLDAAFNGTYTITAIAATTISYALVHANIGSGASTGTVSGEIEGDNTGNGTRTVALSTTEFKSHRWVNTTNVSDQFGRVQAYARMRSNTAGRYSVRVRQGLTDGTNDVFPANGGYVTADVQAVGTHSGNNWAWVYLGEFDNPALASFGATVYGLVFQLYVTCSDITGAPSLDTDAGVWLFPVGEGPVGTGLVQATFDLATAASGVSSAIISAIPGEPPATLANSSDVATFPKYPDAGAPLYGLPARAARVFITLIDATNLRHNHTHALTVTVKHELRHSTVIGS